MKLELLLQKTNLDPVIRQPNSWPKNKSKPVKAGITVLGKKTHLEYFRKFINTSINENTDIFEYQKFELKVPCLPLSMTLLAFHISKSLNTKKDMQDQKKRTQINCKIFSFQKHQFGLKYNVTIV